MERATTVMKTFHGNMSPKSPTLGDSDASFSSHHRPDKPINSHFPPHQTIASGRCRGLDDSTTELCIFDAHKYFNEVTSNDIQKVNISSNSRVSPVVNMDIERNPERGDITEATGRYSSASSSVDGYANIIRNYRARSFHAATPTASSEASWNSQAGLLSHPPGAIPVSMRNPPNPTDLNKKIRASLSKSIWLLRRKCPCTGKQSVEVKEKTPPPPPNNQMARDLVNLKRKDHDPNPKTPILDKFRMNMETAAKKPETHKIPITIPNNNWVDQITQDHATTFVAKSQRFQPGENNQVPAILQPQRVIASVRPSPFTDGFTFPVLNPHSASASASASSMKLKVLNGVDEDPPRDSLEVFRPPPYTEPIDTIRVQNNFPFPTSPNKSRIVDDDAASDASSDLFEIESFSTQTTSTYPISYRRRDSLDEASNFDPSRRLGATATATATAVVNDGFLFGRRSVDGSITPTITECYEPSEASIDWSVTTAEGYDRASVATAADDTSTMEDGRGGGGENVAEKWKRKGSSKTGNGMLLSCRCEEAVSVGPQPVKCGEGQRGATRALASRHVSSRAGIVNKPPLARSHKARVSLAFAT